MAERGRLIIAHGVKPNILKGVFRAREICKVDVDYNIVVLASTSLVRDVDGIGYFPG